MVCECFSDWPYTKDDGWITPEKVDGYMRRWFQQFNPYTLETDRPVGFINYRMNGIFLEITHVGVIPEERGKGHFSTMAKWLAEKLKREGHEIAYFTVLEKSEFILKRFQRVAESEGRTGKVIHAVTDGNF